jgi:hypothetical protein
MPAGRPSDYTPKIANAICARIAGGESLRTICEDEETPDKSTVLRWLGRHQEFRDQYAQARESQMDAMSEEILEIADDAAGDAIVDDNGNVRTNNEVVARSRLRIDTRKWLMSKLAPKKYGDRIVTEHTGKDGGPVEIAPTNPRELARAVLSMLRDTET